MSSADGSLVARLDRVSKWYGAVIGLNEVSVAIEPGLTGLLGPNGSGKSTLLRLLTGQLAPSLGRVEVFGENVWRSARARSRLGFCPEVDRLYEEMTGERFVRSCARLSGLTRRRSRERTAEVLEAVGMSESASKVVRGYSKGMRQRIKLAQALVHDPELIVLDEPLSGVDPEGRLELLNLFRRLRDRGKTVLVSSHILEEVEAVTDRIILIASGRALASGPVEQVRDMLSHHSLTMRFVCRPARRLAARLVEHEAVRSVRLAGGEPETDGHEAVIARLSDATRLLEDLPQLAAASEVEIASFEPTDLSAEAIFEYLVRSPLRDGEGDP